MTTLLGFIEEIRRHAGPDVIPPGSQIEAKIDPQGVPVVEIDGAIWTLIDDTAVRMKGDLVQQYRDGQLVAERVDPTGERRKRTSPEVRFT